MLILPKQSINIAHGADMRGGVSDARRHEAVCGFTRAKPSPNPFQNHNARKPSPEVVSGTARTL